MGDESKVNSRAGREGNVVDEVIELQRAGIGGGWRLVVVRVLGAGVGPVEGVVDHGLGRLKRRLGRVEVEVGDKLEGVADGAQEWIGGIGLVDGDSEVVKGRHREEEGRA